MQTTVQSGSWLLLGIITGRIVTEKGCRLPAAGGLIAGNAWPFDPPAGILVRPRSKLPGHADPRRPPPRPHPDRRPDPLRGLHGGGALWRGGLLQPSRPADRRGRRLRD